MCKGCCRYIMNTEIEKIPLIGKWLSYNWGYDAEGWHTGRIHLYIHRILKWLYREAIKKSEVEFDKWVEESGM